MTSAPARTDQPPHRRRLRLATVAPTVLLAVLGLATAVSTPAASAGASGPVSAVNHSPVTRSIDMYQSFGGLRVRGWMFDPDAPTAVISAVGVVDGHGVLARPASVRRTDVAKAYPKAGPAHGYDFIVPVPEGTHTVCMRATNVGAGATVTVKCRTLVFDYGPIGAVNTVDTRPGALHVRGWTLDPDAVTTAITTRIVVDARTTTTVVAKLSRPDIATVRKGAGPLHGFDVVLPAAQGTHQVCVLVVNVGYGTNNSLGCRSVTIHDSPIGVFALQQSKGKLYLSGWALDHEAKTTALTTVVRVDNGAPLTLVARSPRSDVATNYPGAGPDHGVSDYLGLSEGSHTVCITVRNIGFGSDLVVPCRRVTLNFTPVAVLSTIAATTTGLSVTGWSTDPDTSAAVTVQVTVDGVHAASVVARAAGSTHTGHNFSFTTHTRSGAHTVCVTATNLAYGTHNSPPACRSITLSLSPVAAVNSVVRTATGLQVTGFAFDPDTTGSTRVTITVDGSVTTVVASTARADVARVYSLPSAAHGFAATIAASVGEHRVCITATNVGGGADVNLGCRIVNAVHPVAPGPVTGAHATADYNQSVVTWTPPATDGGAPWTKYVVTASPGGATVTVAATATTALVGGLQTKAGYRYTVTAVNVAGASPAAVTPVVTTLAGPAPQKSPAPISTSRYIRNVRGSSAAELALLRSEGAADAARNPSNHKYLALLDIGGQNQAYSGAVLSATTRFVAYSDLVRDIEAYIDGYHSAQRGTAPVIVAIGTNNDMDVNATTGRAWAVDLVNPIARYAARYSGITVAGANDIEPGFTASYAATRNWLTGFLGATTAGFVFNGSADGCSPYATNHGCNNGWSMAGLYTLAAGAAPTRTVNLPQVYNCTMADQWKFISLTGVNTGQPRINFGGPLTEYTACAQAGGCGSIGGTSAWARMWSNLQSTASLRVTSLPYSTDLRIDR